MVYKMKGKTEKKTVFVGISGGVDSSVSAALLIEQGFDVVGVFIRTWTPDFIECTWQDERRDAMRVCAHLGIPFLECDAEEAYKNSVAGYMIDEYKKGRTPNPDVMCNREVKFGVFWNFAKERGADFIATGHYAVNNKSDVGFELAKSPDSSKDQSYFLWTLTGEDLLHVLFPVGNLTKEEVRKLAKKFDIPVASKKDSQGICFLGMLDMKDFLSHYIPKKKGDVLNENGENIGSHDGAVFFTLGERHGFTIAKKTNSDSPYYVISKDINKNTITVGHRIKNDISNSDKINLEKVNWISKIPENSLEINVQIRYHGEFIPVRVSDFDLKSGTAVIEFKNLPLVAKGQSIVFYDKDVCLGGGIVS